MSNLNKIIFFLSVLALCGSCKFDLFTAYEYEVPTVRIDNMVQRFDTTYVDITVASGKESIDLIGLSYAIDEAPNLSERQQLFDGKEGKSRLEIVGLEPEAEHFVVAFAGNGFSYGESEATQFTPELFSPQVPCSLTSGVININGEHTITNTSTHQLQSDYKIVAEALELKLTLSFERAPTSAAYSIVDSSTPPLGDERTLHIDALLPEQVINFEAGGKIFIDKKGDNLYEISFCDLEVIGLNQEVFGNFELN